MAQFLSFYPRYSLRDLSDGTLSVAEFVFLTGGMLDIINPEATESFEEKVNRSTREAHTKAVSNANKGSGW